VAAEAIRRESLLPGPRTTDVRLPRLSAEHADWLAAEALKPINQGLDAATLLLMALLVLFAASAVIVPVFPANCPAGKMCM
jgi:hypothetical protein